MYFVKSKVAQVTCLWIKFIKVLNMKNLLTVFSILFLFACQSNTATSQSEQISLRLDNTAFAEQLKAIPNAAKFGGATGNYNAHFVAYPNINWKNFGTNFVEQKLGLHHSFPTTQIEHYDHMAAQFDALKRINNIILDLSLIHI